MDRLTALDATFLELEQADEGATMHIGGVLVFESPAPGTAPRLDAIRERIASRLALLPRYSQRLSGPRAGGLAWPHWQDDPRFDIANHIGHAALPEPGGEQELCEWTGDFFSHRLDRTRPLWEMALLEGLQGGRWALASKTHHALVDGVGLVGVAQLLLDVEPGDAPRGADARRPARPEHAPAAHTPEAVAGLARTGHDAARAGLHAVLHPNETLQKSRGLLELLIHDELLAAPHTSINAPIGATRRFQVVRASLPELKAIGRRFGGSVNDVLLAVCACGLNRLLSSRGEPVPARGLRAMVPLNVRASAERLALGNRVSSLFVELPPTTDALTGLRQVSARTRALKSNSAELGASTMIDLAALAPPLVHARLARSLYATRLFNLTITNVPGPQMPLYALGAQLQEIRPLVPLAAEHTLGVAIVSYNGDIVLGLCADRDSTPDLPVLAEGIERGLAELRTALRDATRTHGRRPRASPVR